jgi:hypothetical protein
MMMNTISASLQWDEQGNQSECVRLLCINAAAQNCIGDIVTICIPLSGKLGIACTESRAMCMYMLHTVKQNNLIVDD